MSAFRHYREFPTAPERVFAAIQDPTRLARWWGPEGFSNTFSTFEFREGGSWEFVMHGPDGTDYPNQSEFAEIIPNSKVRINHISLPRFELSISLEQKGSGTALTWIGVFENEAFAEQLRSVLEAANEQNLDRLAAELAGE